LKAPWRISRRRATAYKLGRYYRDSPAEVQRAWRGKNTTVATFPAAHPINRLFSIAITSFIIFFARDKASQ
jgi:hypothetical protein